MARKKPLPLTAAEIHLAKRFNSWSGRRKAFTLPSDARGCEFTNKNLVDLADQYLLEHGGRILLGGRPADALELTALVRRYRAQKAAGTKRKAKARAARAENRQAREAERAAKEAKKARERELAARQGTLAL
jgi:hypothetical protein